MKTCETVGKGCGVALGPECQNHTCTHGTHGCDTMELPVPVLHPNCGFHCQHLCGCSEGVQGDFGHWDRRSGWWVNFYECDCYVLYAPPIWQYDFLHHSVHLCGCM